LNLNLINNIQHNTGRAEADFFYVKIEILLKKNSLKILKKEHKGTKHPNPPNPICSSSILSDQKSFEKNF